MKTLDVPPHLRELVVTQSYEQYSELDQAVWRFVVMQAHRRLCETAHPSYAQGFLDAGIRVDRIPRIEEMSEQLSAFGFSAVCVDGFIPPRAFAAFQARGVLPIAADVRRVEHLAYTPAPDIVHEAAGHAPLLADPAFGHYIRRIGALAERAFSNRADAELYAAIYTLSEVKESRDSTPEQRARAEQAVLDAQRGAHDASESAKVARLYWWTAEYGLVGNLHDYRLYGAGLLSSLGESHFCHDPAVRKLPLTAGCIDVDYDITRAQPQLFVVESFDALDDVLAKVDAGLSYRRGGQVALKAALGSEELATLELDSGAQISGVVTGFDLLEGREQPAFITLRGRCALGVHGLLASDVPESDGWVQPLGIRQDGCSLASMDEATLRRSVDEHEVLRLSLTNGIVLSGTLERCALERGRVIGVVLRNGQLALGARVLLAFDAPRTFGLGSAIERAVPGAVQGYLAQTAYSSTRAPKPQRLDERQRAHCELFDRAYELWRSRAGSDVVASFEQIARELDARFAEDWLLRFNLLESLVKLGTGDELASRLEHELERLEVRFAYREPIATGLGYIRALGSAPRERAARDSGIPSGAA